MKANFKEQLFGPPFWGFKLLAVMAALLIWVYVTVEKNPVTDASYTVTIEMQNLSDSLTVPDTNIQVTVTLQGPASSLSALSRNQIYAFVDFTDAEAGEVTVPVQVKYPDTVSLVSVSPESLTFTLEAVLTDNYNVEAKLNGEPAQDYTALAPGLMPELVSISGSESDMARIVSVYVSADISQISSTYSKNLPVEVLDKDGVNITSLFALSPASVDLQVPVIYTQPDKTVSISASIVGEPAAGYEVARVVISPTTVTAYADQSVLNGINYLSTEQVDIAGLAETTTFSARIQSRDGVTLSPEAVTVVVHIEASYSETFTVNAIELRNVPQGLTATSPVINYSVVVYGPETDVSRISAADIRLYADLAGINTVGDHSLPIGVELPANVYLSTVAPSQAEINVTLTEPEPPLVEPGGEEEPADTATTTPEVTP